MTTTDRDMAHQVHTALQEYADGYNIPAIVRDLIERFGRVDVDSVPPETFWRIVRAREVRSEP